MAKLNLYFVLGALQLLLVCSVLTFAANSTIIMSSPTTSSQSTIPLNASSVNGSGSQPNSSIQACSTIQSCINTTVNATVGNSSIISVRSSCSVVTVSCVGNAPNATASISTSPIATTTTTVATTSAAATITAAAAAAAATTTTTTVATATTSIVESQQSTITPTPPLTSTSSTPTTSSPAVNATSNVTSADKTTATPSSNFTSLANTSPVNSTTSNSTTVTVIETAAASTTAAATATTAATNGSGATSVSTGGLLMSLVTSSPSASGASTSQSSSNVSTTSASQSISVPPTDTSPASSVMVESTSSPTSKPNSNDSTVSNNQSSTVSPTIARTTVYVSSTSAIVVPPTSPPKTKSVSMKVTFDIPFKEEYRNRESKAYKELEKNFTDVLETPFRSMTGFLRVEILSFRKGSVVCDFDVIFNETASPKVEDVKKTLQEASKSGGLGGYAVKNIEAEGEKKDDEKNDDLPMWATVTLILLGALGIVLLITVIILVVLLRRNKESSPLYQVSGEDWTQYESMSMGDYKTRAAEVERGRLRNGGNNQPVYDNHPTSHSNLTYQVPSNGE